MSQRATASVRADDESPAGFARWTAPIALLFLVPVWRRQHDAHYESPPRADESVVGGLLRHVPSHDWLLLGYLLMLLALVGVGDGPHRPSALAMLAVDIVVYAATIWWARARSSTFLSALGYRFGILVALVGSFSQLEWILPAARGPLVDADLHALDLRIFGVEPAVAWDRFVRPGTTEWFSFFYYGYFFLIGVHVLPALFFGRCPRFLSTFGFGFLWLYCVGHVVYTFVPAYGPYVHLSFEHELQGSLWWPLVQRTVASGGARTDVFPSLHTAGPTFLTLYSLRHRRTAPFKYTWLPLAFCTSQIVIATMFLRWHYLIDIVAGLALATSGVIVGELAFAWEEARVAAGGRPAWPALRRVP